MQRMLAEQRRLLDAASGHTLHTYEGTAATEEIERSLKKRISVGGRISGARAKPRAYAPPRYASCTWGFLSNSLAVSARTTVPVSIT